ncbi:DNA gyrase subunit A [Trichinella spiralis]|uniref:DNA gyrase subunit A n=1 Tax=Trichinella spiralis TaxID=6334 RepID=UPI0001EFC64D|nr:DNA gyrase subunit A [Trichinella spiralis]
MASEKNIPTEMPTKANGTEGVKQIPDNEQSSSVDQEDQRALGTNSIRHLSTFMSSQIYEIAVQTANFCLLFI